MWFQWRATFVWHYRPGASDRPACKSFRWRQRGQVDLITPGAICKTCFRLAPVPCPDIFPLSPKLAQMVLDSWRDNKELYMSLKDS